MKNLVYYLAIWYIIWQLVILYGHFIFYGHLVYISQLGSILEGLEMENVGIFFGFFVYFMAVWYIFFNVVLLHKDKSGNPGGIEADCRMGTAL
jgi:hypothetical protein